MNGVTGSPSTDLDSAEDLLRFLRPDNAIWYQDSERQYHRWGFRGQRDSSWHLVPSALRKDQRVGYGVRKPPIKSEGHADRTKQTEAEFWALYEFAELADDLGLEVPGVHHLLRFSPSNSQVTFRIIPGDEWPPDDLLELIATAKHHGVPTRLLDFTFNPLVAAYFAASDALTWHEAPSHAKNSADPGKFAVWAVDLNFIDSVSTSRPRVGRVHVPRAGNLFLHVQEGFFLFDADPGKGEAKPLDRVIEEMRTAAQGGECAGSGNSPVRRVTAPIDCAPEVVHLLAAEGIDKAHMMPTLDNVVQQLERQAATL